MNYVAMLTRWSIAYTSAIDLGIDLSGWADRFDDALHKYELDLEDES